MKRNETVDEILLIKHTNFFMNKNGAVENILRKKYILYTWLGNVEKQQ